MSAGSQTWLNPGLPAVRERAIAVMTDVLKRYDIDGVHIDDYFYPYPKDGRAVFDDSATYAVYRNKGGKLSAADWRRAQVDGFVKELGERFAACVPPRSSGSVRSAFGVRAIRIPSRPGSIATRISRRTRVSGCGRGGWITSPAALPAYRPGRAELRNSGAVVERAEYRGAPCLAGDRFEPDQGGWERPGAPVFGDRQSNRPDSSLCLGGRRTRPFALEHERADGGPGRDSCQAEVWPV